MPDKGIEAVGIALTKVEKISDAFHKELPDEASKAMFKQRWPLLVGSIEKAANRCNFSEVAQLLRESGEDNAGLSHYLEDLEKKKILSSDKYEAIGDIWLDLDEAINGLITEYFSYWCSCKFPK